MKTIRYEGKMKTLRHARKDSEHLSLTPYTLSEEGAWGYGLVKWKLIKTMVWATRNGGLTQEYNKSNSRMTVVQQI